MAEGPEGDDLIEQAYQLREFTTTLTSLGVRQDFKPWHKPRKQFIRLQQWCKHVEKLIKKLNLGEGSSLTYLGLPGEDLLDIRVLEGVCTANKVKLRYLGFDASLGGVTTNLATHEVNAKEFIDPQSIVIGDKFEKLIDKKSVARKRVEDQGTFDVINLDLCDSVTNSDGGQSFPSLQAITELCGTQVRAPGRPWLLFLTTRALQSQMTPELGAMLFSAVLQNLSQHEAFGNKLGERLSLDMNQVKQTAGCETTLEDRKWLNAYVLALSKWLLALMLSPPSYKVTVRLLTSYSYGVMNSGCDMASLAFFFEPGSVSRTDGSGLTKITSEQGSGIQEVELATELIDAIANIQDIDAMLAGSEELMEKYIEKTIALLRPLRYDADAYRNFALGGTKLS